MVREGLRVCEECRRWGIAATQRLPQGVEEGGGWTGEERRAKGRTEQSDAQRYTSTGNTLDLAPCAHIAYSSRSPVEENMLNSEKREEKLWDKSVCVGFFSPSPSSLDRWTSGVREG